MRRTEAHDSPQAPSSPPGVEIPRPTPYRYGLPAETISLTKRARKGPPSAVEWRRGLMEGRVQARRAVFGDVDGGHDDGSCYRLEPHVGLDQEDGLARLDRVVFLSILEVAHSPDRGVEPMPREVDTQTLIEVARRHGVVRLSLFGSFVRGEADEESDLDVLVEFEGGRTLLDLVRLERELQEHLGLKVDVVTPNSLHPLIRERVLAEKVSVL